MKEQNAIDRREYASGGKSRNCYLCGKALGASELKIAMPSRAVGAEGISIDRRVLCSNCYYNLVHRVPVAPAKHDLREAVVAKGRKLLVKEFRA